MKVIKKIKTIIRLGILNVILVGLYRVALRLKVHPVIKLNAEIPNGPFFSAPRQVLVSITPNKSWDKNLWWFGWFALDRPAKPPDWFKNPFSKLAQPDATLDWWRLSDFSYGDIKGLWELSRFDWLVAWATEAATGNKRALDRINLWLDDWVQSNPPYKGPNWKCGQETSIRVMNLITALLVLKQDFVLQKGLINLLIIHLQRIEPTTSYAIGQQNNHATSEAAALFIGGNILIGHDLRAERWSAMGRDLLEKCVDRLITSDGSFSQYSVSYHRLMLDTYSLAEVWRRHRKLPNFSTQLISRMRSATQWLEIMVDKKNGDVPNIGANDGSKLLQVINTDYRDFRPSVQLAAALFDNRDVFGDGPWLDLLKWFEVRPGSPKTTNGSFSFDSGGYHILHIEPFKVIMRYPRFLFRPSQADALHLDLWYKGRNLLRDAGTFSYNSEGSDWFESTAAHNTVEFDARNQMPRIGRFMFADWLKSTNVDFKLHSLNEATAAAAYTDQFGMKHHRQIKLNTNGLTCIDTVSGQFHLACLRWRLEPGEWSLDGHVLRGRDINIEIQNDEAVLKLCTTKESRYYQKYENIPMLSITLKHPGVIISIVST
jgi:hypothetical protein